MFSPESGRNLFEAQLLIKKMLARLHLRQVQPSDLCPTLKDLDELLKRFPDLAGDQTAIGPGDDSDCQSWFGDWRWFEDKGLRRTNS